MYLYNCLKSWYIRKNINMQASCIYVQTVWHRRKLWLKKQKHSRTEVSGLDVKNEDAHCGEQRGRKKKESKGKELFNTLIYL